MISKNKGSKGKSSKGRKEYTAIPFVRVLRVHDFENGRISFNADFYMEKPADGVKPVFTVYNATWIEGTRDDGTEYAFISAPQVKGSDGNYYRTCNLDFDALKDEIQKQITDLL